MSVSEQTYEGQCFCGAVGIEVTGVKMNLPFRSAMTHSVAIRFACLCGPDISIKRLFIAF